jgi:hypothetical protein
MKYFLKKSVEQIQSLNLVFKENFEQVLAEKGVASNSVEVSRRRE